MFLSPTFYSEISVFQNLALSKFFARFYFTLVFYIFWALSNKTILPLTFVAYETIYS